MLFLWCLQYSDITLISVTLHGFTDYYDEQKPQKSNRLHYIWAVAAYQNIFHQIAHIVAVFIIVWLYSDTPLPGPEASDSFVFTLLCH